MVGILEVPKNSGNIKKNIKNLLIKQKIIYFYCLKMRFKKLLVYEYKTD